MRPEFYRHVFAGQAVHWWGRGRRKLSLDLLRRFGAKAHCAHVDIGCGTGQNLALLESLAPLRVVGIDLSPIALELAHKASPPAELIRANINDPLPFADASFDVATIFNVLYHAWIDSEVAVLRETLRILKVDGLLLITEPAFPALSRELDVQVMTKRRYRLPAFVAMLHEAGFRVEFSNYFTSFGAPLIVGAKAIKRLGRKSSAGDGAADTRPMHPALNGFFYGLARLDAALAKSMPMPFGTTIIGVGRRTR